MNPLTRWICTFVASALAAPASAQDLAATLDTGGREWVRRDAEISVRLSRPATPDDGRIAILVGSSDLTDLFRRRHGQLIYRPELQPLPPGETVVEVFLVDATGAWSEIGRSPLRVLRKGGFEAAELKPRLDAETVGLLDDGPEETGRETGFDDGTAQLDLRGSLSRGGWELETALNVVGVTARQQALRFGEDGPEAEKVDLSRYSLELRRGRSRLSLGHVTYGGGRYLIESFNSRGLSLELPLGSWGDISLGAMNGSSFVGWDNLLGLDDSRHQVLSGRLGLELIPRRPGALRFQATALDGSVLPRAYFNQGLIDDRETSDGWSIQLGGSAVSNRLRFTGGYAESRFDNPADPLLDGGAGLTAVEEETRGARHGDLAFDLVQNRGEKYPTTLTLSWRHQQVEPQYRSVAAFVQADRREDVGELSLASGPMSFQVVFSEARDNLDDLPSILTTETRRAAVNLMIPTAQLGGGQERPWAPTLTYSFDRTHQFGRGVPENSGFNESHVPDQVSLNHNAALEWQGERWRLAYSLGYSDQDNRQPGREEADFETLVHGFSVGWMPRGSLDLGLDLSREEADNAQLQEQTETSRYGLNLSWQLAPWSSLAGTASITEGETAPAASTDESTLVDLRWSFRLERPFARDHGLGAQLYLRYSYQDNRSRDLIFGFDQSFRQWSISSGINLSFF